MRDFPIPVVAMGPGTQPEEDNEGFDYLPMPQEMETYRPPRLEALPGSAARDHALARLEALLAAMQDWPFGAQDAPQIQLTDLDAEARALVNDALGEGEVSARVEDGAAPWRIQETVFAGVWRVLREAVGDTPAVDRIELGPIPGVVAAIAAAAASPTRAAPPATPGIMNAPAILAEVLDAAARLHAGDPAHIVNLTLLPVTPADQAHLVAALGAGPSVILSRGYGNCRISSTALARTWWVQYFNAADTLILNTIEVTDMPDVAPAAREDYEDSITRLAEWLETLREVEV